jgi:hypothetical protein
MGHFSRGVLGVFEEEGAAMQGSDQVLRPASTAICPRGQPPMSVAVHGLSRQEKRTSVYSGIKTTTPAPMLMRRKETAEKTKTRHHVTCNDHGDEKDPITIQEDEQ